ncbi:MAG: type III-A CRISPR-associated RAMP protein Csm5, partial [Ignavibacteria bacterium]|nr:type III-A CRISPR-associated RAMP protein Csm5 [Ignavibacteria bacterium]
MLKLHFTTITPLHISNGENLGAGLDYVLLKDSSNSPRYLCKINFQTLAEKLAGRFDFSKNYDLNAITNIIRDTFQKLFEKRQLTEEYFYYKVAASKYFSEFYKKESSTGQKFVLEFINSNGKFYIPASSVKGALLTVLGLDHLGINHSDPHINHKFVFMDSDEISSDN